MRPIRGKPWPSCSVSEARSLLRWAPDEWPVDAGWGPVVRGFFLSPSGQVLANFVRGRIAAGAAIYPVRPLWALELTPLSEVKVVILGQDPYHGPGQAQGLAFSVPPGYRIPPSLRNIFKELQRDLGVLPPPDGSLVRWARQGVLLLNSCLTVEEDRAGAHAGQGWEALTDQLVGLVDRVHRDVVFLLWGAQAQKKQDLLAHALADGRVLCANHPSPLSATRGPVPFLGCGHFGQVNGMLEDFGRQAITW